MRLTIINRRKLKKQLAQRIRYQNQRIKMCRERKKLYSDGIKEIESGAKEIDWDKYFKLDGI